MNELVEEFRSIYSGISAADAFRIGQTKRLCELLFSDEELRNEVSKEQPNELKVKQILETYSVFWHVSLQFLRALTIMPCERVGNVSINAEMQDWKEITEKRGEYRAKIKNTLKAEKGSQHFRRWREMIAAQNLLSIHSSFAEGNIYPVFAIELSVGCSVGCSFCGVGANKFENNFLFTTENKKFFSDSLIAIKGYFGKSAGALGFMYWATEPLDNPDYEKFEDIYYEVFGCVPQITTATAHKDTHRVKKILERGRGRQIAPHRFSVLSKAAMRRIAREFEPAELIDVELVPQMVESLVIKAKAGKNFKNAVEGAPETIACVAGLLINMVRQSVKLIHPVRSDSRHPLGYKVIDEKQYASGDHLKDILSSWEKSYFDIYPKAESHLSAFQFDTAKVKLKDNLIAKLSEVYSSDNLINIVEEFVVSKRGAKFNEIIMFAMNQGSDPFLAIEITNALVANGILEVSCSE